MMLEDDSFNPLEFMEYIISIFLRMKPNVKFIEFLEKLMDDCEFPENCTEKINDKIKSLNLPRPVSVVP